MKFLVLLHNKSCPYNCSYYIPVYGMYVCSSELNLLCYFDGEVYLGMAV